MSRQFNLKINTDALDKLDDSPLRDNDEMNRIMKVGDEIVEVFRKNKITMYDAYLILNSLADSIYLSATYSDDL